MVVQTIAPRAQVAQKYSGVERRKSVRYDCSQQAFCQPILSERPEQHELSWLGEVLNVSAGGIGLSLSRRFQPGTVLFVELPCKLNGQVRVLPAQVVHITFLGKGSWQTGCRFLNGLSDEEAAALL
jgi:hypothetical protein